MKLLIPIFFILSSITFAQKVTYISSDFIREKFPEVKIAEEIIRSKVDYWKKELENYQTNIDNIQLDIEKNKLIWTDQEFKDNYENLSLLKEERVSFASTRFESGGEYDKLVKSVWEPIEKKIFAATSKDSLGNKINVLDKFKSGK